MTTVYRGLVRWLPFAAAAYAMMAWLVPAVVGRSDDSVLVAGLLGETAAAWAPAIASLVLCVGVVGDLLRRDEAHNALKRVCPGGSGGACRDLQEII